MSISPFRKQWVMHIRHAHPRETPEGGLPIVIVAVEEGCETCARFDILSELDWEYDTDE